MSLHIYSKKVLSNHWKGELASFRREVCSTEWTADLQWYQKEKSWSANSLWEQLSWIFLFKHSLDFFPPQLQALFFHIRGFSLALPSSKSCTESAAAPSSPALQSRRISKTSVTSITHCMVKHTWWPHNFSMWPGNFNTTASATANERHSFCYSLGFLGFFPKEKRVCCLFKCFLSSSFQTTFTISHTLDSTKADETWTLTELHASCQGSYIAIMLPCNQNLLQERCGCWQHLWQGYFKQFK